VLPLFRSLDIFDRYIALVSMPVESNVGWVSDSVTHAGVGFRASAQPTQVLDLIRPTYLFDDRYIALVSMPEDTARDYRGSLGQRSSPLQPYILDDWVPLTAGG